MSSRWLTTLIELRRQDRSERRLQLEEALRAAAVLAEKERTLDSETAQVTELRRTAAGAGPSDINRLLAAQRHQAALLLERSSTQQQAEMLSQEIERRRAALVEAEKQVRVLERLAIRRTQQARQKAEAREAKRLDELASLRWKAGHSP